MSADQLWKENKGQSQGLMKPKRMFNTVHTVIPHHD